MRTPMAMMSRVVKWMPRRDIAVSDREIVEGDLRRKRERHKKAVVRQ